MSQKPTKSSTPPSTPPRPTRAGLLPISQQAQGRTPPPAPDRRRLRRADQSRRTRERAIRRRSLISDITVDAGLLPPRTPASLVRHTTNAPRRSRPRASSPDAKSIKPDPSFFIDDQADCSDNDDGSTTWDDQEDADEDSDFKVSYTQH